MIPANWMTVSKNRAVTLDEVLALDGVYDVWVPAELTSMFTTSGGSTNCVAADPVGRMESLVAGSTRHFIQATSGARPTLTLSGDKYYLQFDASDDAMAVASSTALYKFLHDCSGGYVIAAASFGSVADPDATYTLMTTSGDYSPNVGISIFYDDRSSVPRDNSFVARVSRSVIGQYTYALGASNDDVITPTVPYVVEVGIGINGATQSVDGVETDTSLKLYTESTANATYDLSLGYNPYSTIYSDMKFYGAVIFNEIPTEFSKRRARRYLGQLSGIVFT